MEKQMKSKNGLKIETPITKDEEKFIEHTGYLFDWSQCEGLMGKDKQWIPRAELNIEQALELIEEHDYTALPF